MGAERHRQKGSLVLGAAATSSRFLTYFLPLIEENIDALANLSADFRMQCPRSSLDATQRPCLRPSDRFGSMFGEPPQPKSRRDAMQNIGSEADPSRASVV
ncbi:hypothetical protein VTI28DRAFT_5764 [Corynascus sepedonium]